MTVLHYLSVLVAYSVTKRLALWAGNALYPGLGADTDGWRYRATVACWVYACPWTELPTYPLWHADQFDLWLRQAMPEVTK